LSTDVLVIVLFAALLHALWNAAVKHSVNLKMPPTSIFIGAGIVSAFIVPWATFPAAAGWPYLLGSVAAHGAYSIMLGRAYRAGDFSQSYPLMRGLPPLLTVGLVALATGEMLPVGQQMAMLVLCLGILSLVFESGLRAGVNRAATGWALLVALTIAVYTTLDGLGVRLGGDALGYVTWLCFLEGVLLAGLVLVRQGPATLIAIGRNWKLTLLGGATTLLAYGLVIWAMMRAPIALVAAARETSVVFAALLGVVAFKERLGPARMVAIGMVMAGLIAMRVL
jgi:drug/metabolite transporter (DMT)-like permease